MTSSTLNKIAMASLLSLLVVLGLFYAAEGLFEPKEQERVAYPVAEPEEDVADADEEDAVEEAAADDAGVEESGAEEAVADAAMADEGGAPVAGAEGASGASPLVAAVAAGDLAAGAKVFKKCVTCHTDDSGMANKTGPALWNVVGRAVASLDFNYSSAMKEHGGAWTYEALDAYLANPKDAMPGNKMTFAGLRKDGDRANVIAYLRSRSDNPAPLAGASE